MSKLAYDTFLSHSSVDKPQVEALARLLEQRGLSAWLDKWQLIPGNPWQQEIEEALQACTTCCVCIGPGEIGAWQNEEMRAAINRRVQEHNNFRVIPVLLPASARPQRSQLPTFLTQTTWVEFADGIDDEQALHRLVCAIRGVAPGRGPESGVAGESGGEVGRSEAVCPYRGLEVFDVEHAPFFFGRGALTEWLLNALKPDRQPPVNRFLAIIGASGSGKSSLARAGLIAAINSGQLAASADWPVLIIKPGSAPLEALAVKLAASADRGAADIQASRQALADDPTQLHLETCYLLEDGADERRLVVLVDQFEEVFTLCKDEQQRRAFIDNLLYAATVARGRTLVVLAMRADFYARCATHDGLAAAVADHQLLIGAMADAELREAIEQPAERSGCELEPGLTDLLLSDVRDQAGALPLLQFALSQLWEQRQGRRLTLAGYQAIGGLKGALEQRADTLYRSFDSAQQQACQRLFLRLTEPGEGSEDTRRRATHSEIGSDAASQLVLARLTEARLLTTSATDADSDGVVEVSHEALIRGWPRLQRWIEADREGLRIQHRLSAATREWLAHDHDPDYLDRGSRLSQIEDWPAERRGQLSDDEQAFVAASLEQRDAEARRVEQRRRDELAKATELAAEKSRSARRLRMMVGLALLALVVTTGIATYAYLKKTEALQASLIAAQKADEAASEAASAERQRRLAEMARKRAIDASANLADAFQIAAQATDEAESALLAANINLAAAHQEIALGALKEAQASGDIQYFQYAVLQALQAQRQPIGGRPALRAAVWEQLGNGQLERAFAERWGTPALDLDDGFNAANAVAISPDGELLAVGLADGTVWVWDYLSGTPLVTLSGHDGVVSALAFSPDGSVLASASADHSLRLWDVLGGSQQATLSGHLGWVNAVAFSADGKWLASASSDGSVRLWNAIDGSLHRIVFDHERRATAVAFSPDGRQLASASTDGSVRLWELDAGGLLAELRFDQLPVIALAYNASGTLLASGSDDGRLRLWDTASATLHSSLAGHSDVVTAVAFNAAGTLLASSSWDDSVRLWDVASGQRRAVLRGHDDDVTALAFDSSGELLASASEDGTVRLWEAASGQAAVTMRGHQGGVNSVAFNAAGTQLVSSSADRSVRLWDAADGVPYATLRGHRRAVTDATFSADDRYIASSSHDRSVRRWHALSGVPQSNWQGHSRAISDVALNAQGTLLASAAGDNAVRLWDSSSGEPLATLRGHADVVDSVAFSHDGRSLASASWDHTIRLWDIAERLPLWAPRATLRGHQRRVSSVAFSADDQQLASASWDNSVRLWDVAGGVERMSLNAHQGPVEAVAFSPDDRLLASASYDLTVRLWDVASGQPRATLRGHDDGVTAVAFSPDGRQLASASKDHTLRLWDIRPIALLDNGDAPSARAAILSEALQRLWGLRMEDLDIHQHGWRQRPPSDAYPIAQHFSIDFGYGPQYRERRFSMRALLDPPAAGEDKLDQLLRWIDGLCTRQPLVEGVAAPTWDCRPASDD